ncbi:sigma-70 family RNA polymerase sigma factor [Streptomyces sp. NPDC004134]|uniref:sigma-70 family RNA polymerase sigma factor n=1 Tax=Streptomyces sp. NPDC004134 TaxID=3364691 RepID=UPI0036825610
MVQVAEFEAARPQLTALAFRLLGSVHDAEDAVQTTWIKASAAASAEPRNPAAWLTTVLTRVCLDHLRARRRRREEPLLADLIPDGRLAADERFVQREQVSRALLVVLDRLTPPQRVAYVLHDLFGLPFREVAETLGTTVVNAKKHASRARVRIRGTGPVPASASASASASTSATAPADTAVADAFLAAAAGGDIGRLLTLMTATCTRTADPALLPPGTPTTVTGAAEIARETTHFTSRVRTTTRLLVAGTPSYVIAPGGHALATLTLTTEDARITSLTLTRLRPGTPLTLLSLERNV